jgi:hypothetical protein
LLINARSRAERSDANASAIAHSMIGKRNEHMKKRLLE